MCQATGKLTHEPVDAKHAAAWANSSDVWRMASYLEGLGSLSEGQAFENSGKASYNKKTERLELNASEGS